MRNLFKYLTAPLLIAPLFAYAQTVDPVQFTVSPEVPGPYEEVRVEAQGVGAFIGESNITWSRNGATEKSGVGERIYTFTTGALGERTTVRASIQSSSHGTIVRDFVFIPSLVNVVWEADTYTPRAFLGKALYSAGSPLKVVAIPTIILNGTKVANGSLSFQWSRGGELVAGASGLGRNIFSFWGDQLQAGESVAVDVYVGTSRVGRGEVVIPAVDPLLMLYYRDPLLGVAYEQAFPDAIELTGREISVQAEPYYFSNEALREGLLSYTWELNGDEITGPDAARGLLTLRQEGGGTGAAVLSVTAQNNNEDELVQRARASVQIVFGGGTASTNPLSQSLGAAVATFNRIAAGAWINASTGQPQQGSPVTTSGVPNTLTYQPLEPLPTSQPFSSTSIGSYLSAAFRILIIIGALFAVTTLTISGVRYMLAETGLTAMDMARRRIRTSVLGLVLLAASWLILNTINPQLLRFNLIIDPVSSTRVQPGGLPGDGPPKQVLTPQTMGYFEGNAVREALGCGLWNPACFARSDYILYDSSKTSDTSVSKAISDYTSGCTNFSFSNGGFGVVRTVNGSVIGAPGSTALVCSMYSATEGSFVAPGAAGAGGAGETSPYTAP